MNNILTLGLAGVGGAVLGALYFFGLWWTVRRSLVSKRTASRLLLSLLLRTGICVAGFYIIGNGDAERILACLAGFVLARVVVIKLTGHFDLIFDSRVSEAGRAS